MKNFKKYPLLICLIVSFAIIIASALVVGLCGVNLGASLGGGSQMEVVVENDAKIEEYQSVVKNILSKNRVGFDTSFTEDKFIAGEEDGEFTSRVLIVRMVNSTIDDETKSNIRSQIAEGLNLRQESVSDIYKIYSSTKTSNILNIGIGIGVIAVCIFAFGFIRYNVFAGIAFLVALLHNILLYFSLVVLTRIQFTLTSISVFLTLTILMFAVIIRIFERHRELTNLHIDDKSTSSQRLIRAEREMVSPFVIIAISVLCAVVLLFLVSAPAVWFVSANIAMALIVSAYTLLLVCPGVYAYFLEIENEHKSATLSRNSEVNKHIKKKISKATKNAK